LNLIQSIVKDSDGYIYKTTKKYNENLNLIQFIEKRDENILLQEDYEFNDIGQIIKKYIGFGHKEGIYDNWTYDEVGNWINHEQVVIQEYADENNRTEREIEYYY
jgi:hypothetical protein